MGIFKRFFRSKLDEVKDWQDPDREEEPMACQEITIEGVDTVLYGRLLSQATAAGAQFDGIRASIESLEFDWNYDAAAQVLHVTCTKKPFYATCSEVESRIRDLAAKAKTAI
jgi:hypothetical protein